jgi:hypothetical protein
MTKTATAQMTYAADDIHDAIKALQAETPPWRKPPDATPWQARKPDPSLVCPVCRGVGRVELNVPHGDPWRTCPHCQDTGKEPTNG